MFSKSSRLIVVIISGLALLAGLAGAGATAKPAGWNPDPVIYDQARAIPTKSGMKARISLFTKRVKSVRVRIDGEPAVRASRFGKGCGRLECQKWKVYADRTSENECYELKIIARNSSIDVVRRMTVCEPFPDGSV
ncbi:MAG: hypothetical protein M3Y23_00460 [Actinomycetota bacterium]|nr:hypothetical protein [Actinomycetota bacterium]